ncbi:hypothetical protein SpiGrapes_1833 [Sphaerochaeta pleomorpha str. Grapes]|uniref:Uncharacterized protein n=1 Tax=Sphaerochaeta pleomorpha (strain ATCC BAA-1885 / DSM 22778 / Grapes) TaxID=158190 RepID=G8QY63_SPHPG|nr:hypothetical protein [Sphaerochaeta pleomorpha]AEV29628.1 hypothetical protein SpiGrapes_1833 [Sphaerochaeta pleomorpha str. Grapes]
MHIQSIGNDKIEVTLEEPTCIISYSLSYGGSRIHCSSLDISPDQNSVSASFGEIGTITDVFTSAKGLLTVERTWNLLIKGDYRLQASFSYRDGNLENKLLVPSVWYRDNTQGKGVFPSSHYANVWSFLETRIPVPCCEQLFNGNRCFTCATEKASEEQFLASVTNERHGIIISIPGSEWPYSYQGKKSLIDTSKVLLPRLKIDEVPFTYKRKFYVHNQAENDSLDGYRAFVRVLPKELALGKGALMPWETWYEYKLTRLLNLIRKDSRGLAYLAMGAGNGEVQQVYEYTAASFLVKSLEAAYELAVCTQRECKTEFLNQARKDVALLFGLDNDLMLFANLAIKIGQFFLDAEHPGGVFQDCYDLQEHIWGGYLGIGEHEEFRYLVNSRCNGEAMRYYVLLYSQLKAKGIDKPQFLGIAKRVARFYCNCQLSSGSFGRWWTTKGKPVDIQGTNGAYIASFFATLVPYLDSAEPLHSEILAALHQSYWYYGEMANEGSFYGDTLDADSCDKEAGVALLSLFLDLYELEKDKRQLESARLAANFILLWIWQTDSFIPLESPLGKEGFHTTGMTSVSVAHHHLDFYGMAIAFQFLRLSEATGDLFYQEQAILMVNACRQLIATKDNGLGRDASFIGWQPEQINHTCWEYFDRKEKMNGFYEIDIAWVTVLTLGSYLQIQERFPQILQ